MGMFKSFPKMSQSWVSSLSVQTFSVLCGAARKVDLAHDCFAVVIQSLGRVRLCDPMECSTPGLPVQHQLPEFTQTHVHRVGDAMQPSHPLSSPSPPTFNLSQYQGLFK